MSKYILLNNIKIDGGTQMRVSINEERVASYAEIYAKDLDSDIQTMPPVTVFYDGNKYILADGFHRYFASRKVDSEGIYCNVKNGTLRDAILYALKANCEHGLYRSVEDKRKAVMTMLNDAEWKTWSNVKIANACGVSDTFVASCRDPEIKKRQREAVQNHFNKRVNLTEVEESTNIEDKDIPKVHHKSMDDYGPSKEELEAAEALDDLNREIIAKMIDSDDALKTLYYEHEKLSKNYADLKARFNGLMNERNEAVKMVQSLSKQLDKIKKGK